jgi:hypothetical protein
MQNTIRTYDVIGASASGSNWAFVASHLIHPLPAGIKKDLKQYNPLKNENSTLHYSRIIFNDDVKINTLRIKHNDFLYNTCMAESKKELLANFKELVQVNPLDHHVFIYRIRYQKNTLFFDIGPYSDDNLYEGFETLIQMKVGFKYSDDNHMFYSKKIINDFNTPPAIINSFQDNLTLQDVQSKESIEFTYISLPFHIHFKEGSAQCEIDNNQINITCESDKHIIIVARIVVKYRDYRRSHKFVPLGDELTAAHQIQSNMKDLDKPLIDLDLERREIK